MLDAALENQHWSGDTDPAYDTRSDAHGWMPDEDEALAWFEAFIAIGAEGGASLEGAVSTACRKVLAGRFRELWMDPDLRAPLEDAARRLHAAAPWVEGWHAVRETLYYDAGRGMACREAANHAAEAVDRPRLEALRANLEPRDLASQVLAILHSDGTRDQVIEDASGDPEEWDRARERVDERARDLGRRCASDPGVRARLGVELFTYERQHLVAFGEGLGEAASDMAALWDELRALFATVEGIVGNASMLAGFLDAIRTRDEALAERILDACAHDPTMCRVFGDLVPRAPTTARDLERVITVLDDPRVLAWQFSWLVGSERCGLDDDARVHLLASMLRAGDGPGAVIEALMRLRYRERTSAGGGAPRDWLDVLRGVGLQAVVRAIEGAPDRPTSQLDHSVARALRVCLRPDDDRAAGPVIDAILARKGHWWRLEETVAAVAAAAPVAFLGHGKDSRQILTQWWIQAADGSPVWVAAA